MAEAASATDGTGKATPTRTTPESRERADSVQARTANTGDGASEPGSESASGSTRDDAEYSRSNILTEVSETHVELDEIGYPILSKEAEDAIEQRLENPSSLYAFSTSILGHEHSVATGDDGTKNMPDGNCCPPNELQREWTRAQCTLRDVRLFSMFRQRPPKELWSEIVSTIALMMRTSLLYKKRSVDIVVVPESDIEEVQSEEGEDGHSSRQPAVTQEDRKETTSDTDPRARVHQPERDAQASKTGESAQHGTQSERGARRGRIIRYYVRDPSKPRIPPEKSGETYARHPVFLSPSKKRLCAVRASVTFWICTLLEKQHGLLTNIHRYESRHWLQSATVRTVLNVSWGHVPYWIRYRCVFRVPKDTSVPDEISAFHNPLGRRDSAQRTERVLPVYWGRMKRRASGDTRAESRAGEQLARVDAYDGDDDWSTVPWTAGGLSQRHISIQTFKTDDEILFELAQEDEPPSRDHIDGRALNYIPRPQDMLTNFVVESAMDGREMRMHDTFVNDNIPRVCDYDLSRMRLYDVCVAEMHRRSINLHANSAVRRIIEKLYPEMYRRREEKYMRMACYMVDDRDVEIFPRRRAEMLLTTLPAFPGPIDPAPRIFPESQKDYVPTCVIGSFAYHVQQFLEQVHGMNTYVEELDPDTRKHFAGSSIPLKKYALIVDWSHIGRVEERSVPCTIPAQ